MPVELRDGVATIHRDRFRLIVIDTADSDKELEAVSESFEALIDLRSQLVALGYQMHRMESIGPLYTRG